MQTCIRDEKSNVNQANFNMHSWLYLAKYFASNYSFCCPNKEYVRNEKKQIIGTTDAGPPLSRLSFFYDFIFLLCSLPTHSIFTPYSPQLRRFW